MSSQVQRLFDYMQTHDGVSVLEAFQELKICCLHKRIAEMVPLAAKQGFIVDDQWETTSGGARVVRHRLERVAVG